MSAIKKFLVIILALAMVFSTASFAWAEDGVTYSDAAQENVVDNADVNENIDADADVEPEADVPEPAEEEQPVVEEAEEPVDEPVESVESEPVISNEDEAAEKGLLSDSGEEYNIEETDKTIIDSGNCGSNVTYVLYDDGEMVISGNGDMKNWGGIRAPWYENLELIKKIIIEHGVTNIGSYAFNGCSNLSSITIPESVMTIGACAFGACSNLTSVTIPESVTRLGSNAFASCSSLTSIMIPESIQSIEYCAFSNCSSLASIIIPDNVTSIGEGLFIGCSSLTSISFPSRFLNGNGHNLLYFVGEEINLKKVVLTGYGTEVPDYAFNGWESITSITIPNGVKRIGYEAFMDCRSLTSIMIPEGVTSIGTQAFYNCSSLTSITIPENVKSIGYDAFSRCSSLTDIYLVKDSYSDSWFYNIGYQSRIKYVSKIDNHYYYYSTIIESSCTQSGERTGTCVICGEEITETVPAGHNYSEWSITQDSTCSENGSKERTCAVCGEKETEEIKALGHNTIKVEAKEPTELKEGNIEYWMCDRCGKYYADENGEQEIAAESVVIPKLEPEYAEISWSIEDGVLTVSGEGWMQDFETASSSPWYSQRANITKIVVSEGLTHIGNRAFYQCTNVTEVEIASTVESVGEWAFYSNTSLVEVNIPAYVIVLGNSSFRACSSLEKVTFEEDAPSLGTYVFNGASEYLAIHCYENTSGWDSEEWSSLNVSVDHKLGDITIVKEPTCTESGEQQAVCLICGETITEYIPALGHDYVDGYCTRCGEREKVSEGYCGESNDTYAMGANVHYVLYWDGELVISGSGKMHGWENTSSRRAPWYGLPVKSIVIESGVKDIGSYAFYNCNNLTSITIPESVTSIGEFAFCGCSSLTSITIPESVTSIGHAAFSSCSSLTSITIPEGVMSIGGYAFSSCSSLTSITIPEGVTSIGGYAFRRCSNLTSVTIPNSVTSIGYGAFSNCSSLTSITIPDSVTSIDNETFHSCSSLTSITIPEGVTSIGGYAFSNCSSLTSIMIPDSVTSIGRGAFNNCSSLTSITIPDSVTSIDNETFYNCSSLTSITIPNSVTSIGNSAFSYCSSLTSITIPEGLTSIGEGAFSSCSSLTSIMIPNSVTSIGYGAFNNCSSLTSIFVIENSFADTWLKSNGYNSKIKYLNKIDEHYCYEKIADPTCVTTGLKETVCVICGEILSSEIIDIDPDAHNWGEWSVTAAPDCIHDGEEVRVCLYDSNHVETRAIPATGIHNYIDGYCTICGDRQIVKAEKVTSNIEFILYGDGELVISGNGEVNSDYFEFFSYRDFVNAITIEYGITKINPFSFSNYRNVLMVNLPNSLKTIGGYAFEYCSSLTSITIPESVISIGGGAFEGCVNLTSITIPESVTSIDSAFYNCSSLKSIYVVKGSKAATALEGDTRLKYVTKSGEHYIYETIKKKATLTANGTLGRKCTVCGEVLSDKTIYYPKTIKLSATSYTYDGKVKKPTVTVKDSKGNTISKTNYTVTYPSGRKNVGAYKVTITFKGNYSGTKTLTFKINPKGTTLKTLTATSKGFKATWTKQATKMSTSYITGYEIQYSTSSTFASGNKTVTVAKYSTVSKTISKLTAKKKYYVRIRTYKTVSGVKYYSPWSAKKYVTTKA